MHVLLNACSQANVDNLIEKQHYYHYYHYYHYCIIDIYTQCTHIILQVPFTRSVHVMDSNLT